MRELKIIIDNEKNWIYFDEEIIKKIASLVSEKEKIGYLFADKVKNTNEYRCRYLTLPHKKDISNNDYSKISWRHRRVSQKMKKANPYLLEIGFYHTHPQSYGNNPSKYDLLEFYRKSKNRKIVIFLIAIKKSVRCFVYSYGEKIKEEDWGIS